MSKLDLKHDSETVTISKKEYKELRETKTFIDNSEIVKIAEIILRKECKQKFLHSFNFYLT